MLTFYNSLTKQKEEFKPIEPGKVGIYVCGMTVYDHCHIGHARGMVVFDILARFLRQQGYEVNYVRNITDIDDKIIARAEENGESWQALTERFIADMYDDAERLGVLPVDSDPRATDYMPQMVAMIETLIEKGYAYVADDGDVLYDVMAFKGYGKLAHKDLESLQAGARVAITETKRNPLDFVLWKMAKPGEPSWGSPWGQGRPGWHIECSAMATDCLGKHFDIHGGGADLKFPHHENEIAQSEAANDHPFVNYWMHVGFVQVNKEKMSKSLGNFFTIREVLEKYHPEVVRYFMISSHYRSPINYSQESLEIATGALERFYGTLRDLTLGEVPKNTDYEARFILAMNDDLNTPEALAVLFDITHEINRIRTEDSTRAGQLGALLKYLAGILGILTLEPEAFLHSAPDVDEAMVEKINSLIAAREEARKAKDWAKADTVRDELSAMKVELEDTPDGTKWRLG